MDSTFNCFFCVSCCIMVLKDKTKEGDSILPLQCLFPIKGHPARLIFFKPAIALTFSDTFHTAYNWSFFLSSSIQTYVLEGIKLLNCLYTKAEGVIIPNHGKAVFCFDTACVNMYAVHVCILVAYEWKKSYFILVRSYYTRCVYNIGCVVFSMCNGYLSSQTTPQQGCYQ